MTQPTTRRAVLGGAASLPAILALPSLAIAAPTAAPDCTRAIVEGYLEFLTLEKRFLLHELYGDYDYPYWPANTITRAFHFPYGEHTARGRRARAAGPPSSRAIAVLSAAGIDAESAALDDDRAPIEMSKKLAAKLREHLSIEAELHSLLLRSSGLAESRVGYTFQSVTGENWRGDKNQALSAALSAACKETGHDALEARCDRLEAKLDRLAARIENWQVRTVAGIAAQAVAALWWNRGLIGEGSLDREQEKSMSFIHAVLLAAGMYDAAKLAYVEPSEA